MVPMAKPWTPTEEDYVRQNYATMPLSEIARHLGRGEPTVRDRAHRLGVKKYSRLRRKPKNNLPARLRPAFRDWVAEVAEEMRL